MYFFSPEQQQLEFSLVKFLYIQQTHLFFSPILFINPVNSLSPCTSLNVKRG